MNLLDILRKKIKKKPAKDEEPPKDDPAFQEENNQFVLSSLKGESEIITDDIKEVIYINI